MSAQTLTLGGRRFVILPEAEYHKLTGKSSTSRKSARPDNAAHSRTPPSRGPQRRRLTKQDLGDLAEHKRRMAEGESRPYSELRKELGLE